MATTSETTRIVGGPMLAGLLVALAIGLALPAGCRERSVGGRPRTYLLVGLHEHDPLWPVIQAGAKQYAGMLANLKLRIVAPAEPDPALQAALVQRELDASVYAVCLQAVHAEPTRRLVDEVTARGIPVVLIGQDIAASSRYGYAGWDEFEAGKALSAALDAVLADRSTYMLLYAGGENPILRARLSGFNLGMERFSGPKELRRFDCQGDPARALEVIRQQARRYPRLAVWASLGDWPLGQGLDALREALPPETGIVTVGLMPAQWPLLESGLCRAAVATEYGRWGHDAVAMCELAFRRSGQPGEARLTPPRIVRPADLPGFKRDWDQWLRGNIRAGAEAPAPQTAPAPGLPLGTRGAGG